jgi:hypothetical protein
MKEVYSSTTSSALSRMDVGIVMPSACATFGFTAISKRVGCSTGRSAGLAPISILSIRRRNAEACPVPKRRTTPNRRRSHSPGTGVSPADQLASCKNGVSPLACLISGNYNRFMMTIMMNSKGKSALRKSNIQYLICIRVPTTAALPIARMPEGSNGLGM